MKNSIQIESGTFIESSLIVSEANKPNFSSFYRWYDERMKEGTFNVEIIPFSSMDKWAFTEGNCEIVHDSGKFFRIEGIHVQTNFGLVRAWDQPIINQPEIGILGIITKLIEGTRYFLMQTKMEPGNINYLQISPTLQATKSNFTKVHQGKTPEYLEYFVDRSKSNIIYDQLQTEQGGRFLRKRNRNMVVEIFDEIEVYEDFKWMTLGEIKELLTIDNIINMDARSVISTIPLIDEQVRLNLLHNNIGECTEFSINGRRINGFGLDVLKSICDTQKQQHSEEDLISWLTQQRVNYELELVKRPLSKLQNWQVTDERVYNSDRFFSVIAVRVSAGTREVASWCQPLIADTNVGLLGMLCQKINGILHFLIQAKVEPGNLDVVELSPTVTCSNYESVLQKDSANRIEYICYFQQTNQTTVHFDTIQSEEGGRFYQMQNRNMIVELDEKETLSLQPNYIWMTLNQVMDFMKFGKFNIEARSIISSLKFV